jgi:integrase
MAETIEPGQTGPRRPAGPAEPQRRARRALRLTEKIADHAAASRTDALLYDSDVRGLALRVRASGAASWVFAVNQHGRSFRVTLGPHQSNTGAVARMRVAARALRVRLDQGEDVVAVERAKRQPKPTEMTTFRELACRWLDGARTGHDRGSADLDGQIRKTWAADAATLKRWFGVVYEHAPCEGTTPRANWSRKRLDSLTCEIVKQHLSEIRESGSPVAASHVRSLLSSIFNAGIAWGVLTDNPAKMGRKAAGPKHQPRTQYLDDAGIARLLVSLADERDPRWRAFFGLTIHLGTRRGELLALRWDRVLDLDGEHPSILLDPSTTKTGIGRALPLPEPAAALLRELADDPTHGRRASPLVFPSRRGSATGALVGVRKAWLRVCERAGIDGKEHHLHDLRRGLATALNAAGRPAAVAQHLLGHATSSMTTKVYTATPDAARRDALNERSSALARAIERHREKVRKIATPNP